MIRRIFGVVNACIEKNRDLKWITLFSTLKDRKKQTKSKENRKKGRINIRINKWNSEYKNKKVKQNWKLVLQKDQQYWQIFSRLTKKKGEKIQIARVWNEGGDITSEITEIKRIMREECAHTR